MTTDEVLALPAVIDLDTANQALMIGRSTGYGLAKQEEYPVKVLRLGNAYRVVTADLLSCSGWSGCRRWMASLLLGDSTASVRETVRVVSRHRPHRWNGRRIRSPGAGCRTRPSRGTVRARRVPTRQ